MAGLGWADLGKAAWANWKAELDWTGLGSVGLDRAAKLLLLQGPGPSQAKPSKLQSMGWAMLGWVGPGRAQAGRAKAKPGS